MSEVYAIADRYVERFAALDPIAATGAGIAGHEHELTDFSPAGAAARAELARDDAAGVDSRPTRLRRRPDRGRRDARTAAARRRPVRRGRAAARHPHHRQPGRIDPRVLRPHGLRHAATTGRSSRARMARVPDALASLEASLREGMARGIVAARRQALACADQAATWGGDAPVLPQRSPPAIPATRASPTPPTPRPPRTRGSPRSSATSTRRSPTRATPSARERYALFARAFNGIELDLDETYAVGMGGAVPHRGRDAPRRRAHPPGRAAPRGDRAPRPRPDPLDRRRRRVPALEPGAHRHDDRRARRHALRHRRAAAPVRGDDRAARRRGRDVLHGPERGLLPARPHVVPDAGQHARSRCGAR